MARPAKSLAELVRAGTFRARRDTHRELLTGGELPWPGFAVLQRRFRAATSEPERRAVALEFEQAVALAHDQATSERPDPGRALQAELAQLGKPGSLAQLCAFFPAYLTHTKGPLRGQPFHLERWQQQFLREFYRRDKHGRRIYRLGILALPRGCGKTQIAAGLALYELLSRSDAPEIYLAAASKEQAGICFSFARGFVEAGPLADWVKVKASLRCPASNGTLEVISSEGTLQHGRAPAVAIIDELWAFQDKRQIETYTALSSALHKRQDSYILAITTAGYDRSSLLGRIYDSALDWPDIQTSRNGCHILARDQENGSLLSWYGAPADAAVDDRRLWRASNPASWIRTTDLNRQLHDPGLDEPAFRRLHLNQWTAARNSWLPAGAWMKLRNDALIPEKAHVYIGVDVALSHDTTAVAWAHPTKDGTIILRARVWSANEQAAAHVHVPGGKILLEDVEAFIRKLGTRFRVREIAYDPRFFERSAQLLEREGFTLVEFLQASAPMYDAYQRFYQLVVTGRITHNGDNVLAAHIAATAARPSDRGWRPSKQNSRLVIDGTVAASMAVARADTTTSRKRTPNIHWIEL